VEPVMYGIQFGTGAFASYAYPSKEDAEKLSSWSHQPNKVVSLFTRPAPPPTGERDELIQALRFFSYDMPAANCMMRKAADMLAADIKP